MNAGNWQAQSQRRVRSSSGRSSIADEITEDRFDIVLDHRVDGGRQVVARQADETGARSINVGSWPVRCGRGASDGPAAPVPLIAILMA
ncbi:MAG: hypothetical protein JST91_25815 [Actinobacteria bacterium]|nr:hypothetical protein [Actinomycetota bacterium]